ncbi:hypothetical protein CBS101457_004517 [Exobasidium rhododendri]|nr:hypothetical protein CBS101457_004517 [Exobasidium rhododendri]
MMASSATSRTSMLLLLPLLFTVFAAASSSSSASIYMHPVAPGKGRAADISAIQANHILAHLLDVPEETLGAAAGDRDPWDWLQPEFNGKQAVEDLFNDSTQRNVVLFSGLSEDDAQDVMPSQIRHTHQIKSSPHAASFEALLQSYGERIYSNLPVIGEQFGGFFTATLEGVETALESAADWLAGGAYASQDSWKKSIDDVDISGEASATFYRSIRDLVAFFDAKQQSTDVGSYRVVRFSGLREIKAAYGSDSVAFKRAKEALQSILRAAVEQVNQLEGSRPQKFAFIVLPEADDSLVPRSMDLLSPFRSSLSLTPFLTTRDVFESLKNNSKAPKEADFIGKCFTEASALMKATADCSGHGKAIQSSKGGRKCYRCSCQQTKGKGGKVISWAGAACQKQDISKPFVLLLITTIGLISVIMAAVLYLFSEGQQELPSVLAGISIPNK